MGQAAKLSEPVRIDPAAHFRAVAPDLLDLDDLIAAFGDALEAEGGHAHMLCALAPNGATIPLFGDREALTRDPSALALPLGSAEGEPLVMLIAAGPGFDRARGHALAAHAAAYGLPLLDAGTVDLTDPVLSPDERACLTGLLHGASRIDLADELELTPEAVAIHLRRARHRLGAGSDAEAMAVAMRRGFVSED